MTKSFVLRGVMHSTSVVGDLPGLIAEWGEYLIPGSIIITSLRLLWRTLGFGRDGPF